MKVSDIGEFGLIDRLGSLLGGKPPADLVIGIGDDCAVWRAGEHYLLATTDTLVEAVHFLPTVTPWEDVGWKALAVNVSDVAAMGGIPMFALVTLTLPKDTPVEATDALYKGLDSCARAYGVTVVGGDIVAGAQAAITVALIGRAQMRDGVPLLMRRDGAKAGDVIAVTGSLGASAVGLLALREGASPEDPLPRSHLHPEPPIGIAQAAALLGVACAIDVSDGLMQDVGHICKASRLGAVLFSHEIPVDDTVTATHPEDALKIACTGGEDYEVVLVARAGVITALNDLHPWAVTTIGKMSEKPRGTVSLMDKTGAEVKLPDAGWDHLTHRTPV
jgi:thiamine-monophosphate kinase